MENQETKITPQDIIDKEFRVKFRGFDMAEVDSFLEEVAESFFRLTEENTLLNEKVLELQQDLQTLGNTNHQGMVELPAELSSILEDLKQDTATTNAELAALKQERQTFDSLREKLEKAISALHETGAEMVSRPQVEFPADLADSLERFKLNSEAIAAELAALKEDRQNFASMGNSFEEVVHAAREAAASMASGQEQAALPADLGKTLAEFKQGSDSIGAELAALKQEVGVLAGMRQEIKKELQELLATHLDGITAKISAHSTIATPATPQPTGASPTPEQKETLLAATIVEEPEGRKEETSLPDYRAEDDDVSAGDDLEFLSEDDILDVDKLRDIFQSVLDEGLSDAHEGREGDDVTADLLFLEDDLTDDDHEPEVTFSLDDHEQGKKQNSGKRKPF